jgi:hypothetical protein
LIGEQTLQRLWGRAKGDNTYYAGFLAALPDALPGQSTARADWDRVEPVLAPLLVSGNKYARQLARVLGAPGQTFLAACGDVLSRPADQDVARSVFRTVGAYFGVLRQDAGQEIKPDEALAQADFRLLNPDAELAALLAAVPALQSETRSLLALAEMGEFSVAPILVRTTAIGSLMRRKLEPVSEPVMEQLAVLRGALPAT